MFIFSASMNRTLLFAFLWIGLSPSFGQDTYRENLTGKLSTQTNKKFYLQRLTKSEKQYDHLAVIYNELGLVYQKESALDSADYCHRKALSYSLKVSKRNQEIAISNNKIGVVFYYRGQHDSAAYYFEKAIPYYTDQKLKANSLNNLALMNKYNSNPDVAIANYLSALTIYLDRKDTLKQIYVYNNIGALHIGLEEYDKAKSYFMRGLKLAESDVFIDARYNCKSNLASLYNQQGKEELAIPIFEEVIAYYQNNNDYPSVIVNLNNLAESYSGSGRETDALQLYLEVLELMESSGIEQNKEAVLLNIGSCYEELGQEKLALVYYQRSNSFAHANNLVLNYETIYKGLSSVHMKLNNSDSSIYYKDLQIALHDSLDNVEKEKKMMELESKFQNDALGNSLKNKEDELTSSENKRSVISKNLFYLLIGTFIVLAAAILFFVFYKRKKRLAEDLSHRNAKNRADISSLESSLGSKDDEIERLSVQKETGKLPYPEGIDALTVREKEVLEGVKEGLKDQEIAEKLFISIATVRTHLRKAYVKIDARNRAEAIQFISKYTI